MRGLKETQNIGRVRDGMGIDWNGLIILGTLELKWHQLELSYWFALINGRNNTAFSVSFTNLFYLLFENIIHLLLL